MNVRNGSLGGVQERRNQMRGPSPYAALSVEVFGALETLRKVVNLLKAEGYPVGQISSDWMANAETVRLTLTLRGDASVIEWVTTELQKWIDYKKRHTSNRCLLVEGG